MNPQSSFLQSENDEEEVAQFMKEAEELEAGHRRSSSMNSDSLQLRKTRLALIKKYRGCKWVSSLTAYCNLWLEEADLCVDPLQVYSYMYRSQIGTETDIFYTKWFALLINHKFFLYALHLLQKIRELCKNKKPQKGQLFTQTKLLKFDKSLDSAVTKFYTKYFEKVVKLNINPRTDKILYQVTKYDTDKAGITENDCREIVKKSLDAFVDKHMDEIFDIRLKSHSGKQTHSLKRKSSQEVVSQPTFGLVSTKRGRGGKKRFSDIIGRLNPDPYKIFMDKAGQQMYISELEFKVYELEFLSKRFKHEFEKAMEEYRAKEEDRSHFNDFWVREEYLEQKGLLKQKARFKTVNKRSLSHNRWSEKKNTRVYPENEKESLRRTLIPPKKNKNDESEMSKQSLPKGKSSLQRKTKSKECIPGQSKSRSRANGRGTHSLDIHNRT